MTTLLVASTGGHLDELATLRHSLVPSSEEVVWVTFDSPQSRTALGDQIVEYVRFTAPRDYSGVLINSLLAPHLLRRYRPQAVVSTGSGIALAFLPLASWTGRRAVYIESAARTQGPSRTGKVLERFSRVELYSQYPNWDRRWRQGPSVFDGFRPERRPGYSAQVRSVFVSVGTQAYSFAALVERVRRIVPANVRLFVQSIDVVHEVANLRHAPILSPIALEAAMLEADVVITHAGIGSAMQAMRAGRKPALVPRRLHRQEHVDDHQAEVAVSLERSGLAFHREVDELHWKDLVEAAQWEIHRDQGGRDSLDSRPG